MPQKKPKEEPEHYFPKITREYRIEELRYIRGHIFGKKRRVLAQRSPKAVQAANLLDQIRQGWSKESGLAPFEEEKDKCVIEAVKLFSATALLAVGFPARLSEEANCLGGAVCRVLGYLRQQALTGNKSERQIAIRRLKNITKAIIPETRGKSGDKINTFAVKYVYHQKLFWLHQIRNALKSSLGARNQSQKVKDVSKNFGMPVDQIRWLLGLDYEDKLDRQPFTVKEMARQLTARHFRITQNTLANILAS